jgi:hypothetical protein
MKTFKYIITGLLIIGLAGIANAGKLSKDSSWEEILSNDTLKVVFPTISVGNGKFVSYDHLFLDNDQLTTGKTFEDAVAFEYSNSDRVNDRGPTVIQTVSRQEVAALNYTTEKCDEVSIKPEFKETYAGPLVCYPVEGQHETTVNVSVYKKAWNTKSNGNESRSGADTFLFSKKYTIPVYSVEEVNG